MKTIRIDLGERSYPAFVSHVSLRQLGEMCTLYGLGPRYVVITNAKVRKHHGDVLVQGMSSQDADLTFVEIGDGERYKNVQTAEDVIGKMLAHGSDRQTTVLAFGGGVVGDLAGFVASVYMRGVPLIQVPTTLLAQVDASLGGKTGVNHALGKNMIGTFYQPRLVWIDTSVLETLESRELACGVAEIIKYGVIRDANLFSRLESDLGSVISLDPTILQEVVSRSCEIKAEIVAVDERERGLREVLNFGHTVAHAIESATAYERFSHGEAVLLGMKAEAAMAHLLGRLPDEDFGRVVALIQRLDSTVDLGGINAVELLRSMWTDKKNRSGEVRIVLPSAIGGAGIAEAVSEETLEAGISQLFV